MSALIGPPSTCQDCHHVCVLGAAEYHPAVFCRLYKLGLDPWGRTYHPVLLDAVPPPLKAKLQDRARRLLREYHSTEVTLP